MGSHRLVLILALVGILALGAAGCGTDDEEPVGVAETTTTTTPTGVTENGGCHPSYKGACLEANASDYDCEGGTGDGPKYTGRVEVTGSDPYDLDADGDGVGCE